jgi:hypothetical protein
MGFHKLGTPTIRLFLWQFKPWGEFHCPNPLKSKTQHSHIFSNVDLVWKDGFRHASQTKVAIEIAYILHVRVSKFLQGEQGICKLR